MSIRTLLAIGTSLRKSQDRSMKIHAARDAKRQKDELFDLNKRQINLKIEEMEKKTGPDSMVEMLKKQLNDQFKAEEANSKVADNTINTALAQEDQKTKQLNKAGSSVARTLMNQPLDWSYNTGSQNFSISPRHAKQEKLTDTQQFRKDTQRFIDGDITERQLRYLYPDKDIGEVVSNQAFSRPAKINPEFRHGVGASAYFNPNVANIKDNRIASVLKTIRSEGDLDFVLTDPKYRGELKKAYGNAFLSALDRTINEVYEVADVAGELGQLGDFSDL